MILLKKLLLEKTLYHGTTIDAAREIASLGGKYTKGVLVPMVGNFVKLSYGCEYDETDIPELVFATDKKQLDKAVGAITAQIAEKLKKNFHDVTDEEFIAYGAILKIKDGENYFQRRPDKDEKENCYAEYPSTVEPGDYYSEDNIGVDAIITGNAMIRLLKRHHLWPRAYGGKSELDNRKKLLIKMAIKHHPDKNPKDIVKKVLSLSPKETNDFFYHYRRLTNIEL